MNYNAKKISRSPECHCIIDAPQALTPRARLSSSIDTQWTKLDDITTVVATANSAWLHVSDPDRNLNRFSSSMDGISGTVASTQNLLDGAIATAFNYCNESVPDLTLGRWIWKLAGHYHLTSITPLLLADVAESISFRGRPNLVHWARRKASREKSYNLTTIIDMEYLGYDACYVINDFNPEQADILIDYIIDEKGNNPFCSIAYSYTMETIATRAEQDYLRQVESLMPPNISCLRQPMFYGSLGVRYLDVQETLKLISSLSAAERSSVAKACYEIALICFTCSETIDISDSKLERMLKPL